MVKPMDTIKRRLGRFVIEKQKARDRRLKLYEPMVERGLRNVDMAQELGISSTVVAHDLRLLGIHAHRWMHWRLINANTGQVTYYASISEMRAVRHFHTELVPDRSKMILGAWTIEHGAWYQDKHGEWQEAPNESL